MEFLTEYGLFLMQSVTVMIAVLIVTVLIIAVGQRQRGGEAHGHIETRKLNERYRDFRDSVQHVVLGAEACKRELKRQKKQEKKAARRRKKGGETDGGGRQRLYVLDFEGDIKASAAENLREEISAVLAIARDRDEVLLRLESSGGMVHSYGLAASQLQRIRDAGVQLTVSVDKVAASGGYMMACVANRIMAAPFALIGSIGVIAQLPNFHRLLDRANVDYEQITAGEYKRTLTLFGENTERDRSKMQEDVDDTHLLFKDFVSANRPGIAIDKVATGEVWYGRRALEQGLIDVLQTSDAYLQGCLPERDVFELRHVLKKSWQERLGIAAEGAIYRSALKAWQLAVRRRHF